MSGKVRIICNSGLDPDDVKSVRAAAMRLEGYRNDPERMAEKGANRFERLYRFLNSGKLEVKVLLDFAFGLIHGKAGVFEMADGRCTSFLGSANESKTAWQRNLELVWEDENPESIQWIRDEFDALWGPPDTDHRTEAVALAMAGQNGQAARHAFRRVGR